MRLLSTLFILLFIVVSCTKEVPESEKNIVKSVNENEIKALINNHASYFNSGDVNSSLIMFSDDYSEYIPDSDAPVDLSVLENNLLNFRSQNPEGKLSITVEDLFISNDLAAAQTFTSYLVPDPIEGKLNPAYSERSIKLLRKDKNTGWKIFRSLSSTAFSYD
jgi:ketosteroid isomerase-like protein